MTDSNFSDPNGNHLSIHTRGTLPNSADEAFSLGATTAIPDLKLGNIHTVKVKYDPGVLMVFMDDDTSAALTVPIELPATLELTYGKAWIGFTSSTWNSWASHDILNASLTVIPEPCTIVLAAFGILVMTYPSRFVSTRKRWNMRSR